MKFSSEPPTAGGAGKSRHRDWNVRARLKNFDRDWKFRARLTSLIAGPSGKGSLRKGSFHWRTDLFFMEISGRNFLPELCGGAHPETAPLQALCCALHSSEESTFRGGEKAKRCWEKGRKSGGQQKGQKGKKDVWKQARGMSKVSKLSRISRKWSDYLLFSRLWGFSKISRISNFSRISRKWTFLKRPLFQKILFSEPELFPGGGFCGQKIDW